MITVHLDKDYMKDEERIVFIIPREDMIKNSPFFLELDLLVKKFTNNHFRVKELTLWEFLFYKYFKGRYNKGV